MGAVQAGGRRCKGIKSLFLCRCLGVLYWVSLSHMCWFVVVVVVVVFRHACQMDKSAWSIEAHNDEGQEIEEVQPNFWPIELYNQWHDEEAHVDAVSELTFKGKVIKGVDLEDDGRLLPSRVLKLKNFDSIVHIRRGGTTTRQDAL